MYLMCIYIYVWDVMLWWWLMVTTCDCSLIMLGINDIPRWAAWFDMVGLSASTVLHFSVQVRLQVLGT